MPRNVLLILSDEFRPDCLPGGRWADRVKTPHLDALAWDGVLFEQCYCQASPCAPSRMSIHTGKYMCATGAVDNMTPLLHAGENLGKWLRRHGVAPGLAGYNDYAVDPATLPEGHPHRTALNYDHFLPGYEVVLDHEYDSPEWYDYLRGKGYPPEDCNREVMYAPNIPAKGCGDHLPCHYPARYKAEDSEANFLAGKSIDYMEAHKGGGWFLNVNFIKPHGPYIACEPYLSMYPPETIPAPIRTPEEFNDSHPYFRRMAESHAKRQYADDLIWRETRACYFAMAAEIDACVGRLVDYLKQSGQWEDTMVIFGADHGSCLGDHYLDGKPHFYESAVRVPLIIHDPRLSKTPDNPARVDTVVANIDLAPTICAFLGVPTMPWAQGRDLSGLLLGNEADKGEGTAFYEYYYYNVLAEREGVNPASCRLWMLREGRYKYVQFGEPGLPPFLFDLAADPDERVNLGANPAFTNVMLRMCQSLIRWRIGQEDLRAETWARQYR